jgi:hypothetical protein
MRFETVNPFVKTDLDVFTVAELLPDAADAQRAAGSRVPEQTGRFNTGFRLEKLAKDAHEGLRSITVMSTGRRRLRARRAVHLHMK